jgi:hypothetical protein
MSFSTFRGLFLQVVVGRIQFLSCSIAADSSPEMLRPQFADESLKVLGLWNNTSTHY